MSTTAADPTISRVDPLAVARELATLIAAGSLEGEALGRLPDATAAALLDARLFSVLLPPTLGGYGRGHADLFDVIEEVSRADASAGWCVSIGTTNNTGMGEGLPPAGLAEVFGEEGRVVAAGSLAPVAVSEPAEGGFLVSGRFSWASGSGHADWYVASSLTTTDEGGLGLRFHVLPMSDCEPVDTWHVAGLKATCSRDLVVESVLVPVHRCYEMAFGAETFADRYARSVQDASVTGGERTSLRRGPSIEESTVVGVAGLAAWSSGVARRALEELVALAPVAKRLLADGMLADDGRVRLRLAEVESPLLALRAQLRAQLEELDRHLAEGVEAPESVRVAAMEAALGLTRSAREAVLFAFDVAPAKAVYLDHPLQRCLRDLLTGLKHAAGSPAMFEKVGQARLGIAGHGL